MASLVARRAARKNYTKVAASTPVGEGGRFKAVAAAAKASGVSDPGAVAAAIGRKKYGQARMTRMAVAGRKK